MWPSDSTSKSQPRPWRLFLTKSHSFEINTIYYTKKMRNKAGLLNKKKTKSEPLRTLLKRISFKRIETEDEYPLWLVFSRIQERHPSFFSLAFFLKIVYRLWGGGVERRQTRMLQGACAPSGVMGSNPFSASWKGMAQLVRHRTRNPASGFLHRGFKSRPFFYN